MVVAGGAKKDVGAVGKNLPQQRNAESTKKPWVTPVS